MTGAGDTHPRTQEAKAFQKEISSPWAGPAESDYAAVSRQSRTEGRSPLILQVPLVVTPAEFFPLGFGPPGGLHRALEHRRPPAGLSAESDQPVYPVRSMAAG